MSSAGRATKEIIVGLALFFSEILLYLTVRPAMVYTMTILVNSFSPSPKVVALAAQMGIYVESAWALLVIATVVVFIILPAFSTEPVNNLGF